MGYGNPPLDEIDLDQLKAEVQRREKLYAQGICPYCGQPARSTRACSQRGQHQHASMYAAKQAGALSERRGLLSRHPDEAMPTAADFRVRLERLVRVEHRLDSLERNQFQNPPARSWRSGRAPMPNIWTEDNGLWHMQARDSESAAVPYGITCCGKEIEPMLARGNRRTVLTAESEAHPPADKRCSVCVDALVEEG